jgi:surface antigen
MKSTWMRTAVLLAMMPLLVPLGAKGTAAQATPTTSGWPTYRDAAYSFRLSYPPDWRAWRAFDNPPGEPYLIRRRVILEDAAGTQIWVDVWDREAQLSLEAWFETVEGITPAPEANAVLAGQPSFVRVEGGGCGGAITLATYVPTGQRIYRILLQYPGDASSLEGYEAVLRSFSLIESGPTGENIVPDLAPMVPVTCGTNICPSTCYKLCTFAAVSEGCCGYHRVARWQCAKECVGSVPGGFQGNCVWWGAYTRRDVGALAWGNASNWADSVRSTGQLPIDGVPRVGDIVVHPGTSYNHVAYVVKVSASGARYRVSDMGWCGDCGPTPEEAKLYTVDADDEFIHCAGDPTPPTSDWTFTDCPFGWTPSKGWTASDLDGAAWVLNPDQDPYLLSPILSIPADDYSHLVIRMANSAEDTGGKIYFTTSTSPTFDEAKSIPFTTNNDGQWWDYQVPAQSHPEWQGTITRIRVDPVGAGNADGSYDDVGVVRIAVSNNDTTPPTEATNLHLSGPPDTWWAQYTRSRQPTFAWDPAEDLESGIAGYYVGLDRSDRHRLQRWDAVGQATTWTAPPLGEGAHDLIVATENGQGLHAFSAPFSFVVDTTPPSNPDTIDAGCTLQNNLWQNECYDPTFTWSGAYDHGGSGVKDYHYYWGPAEAGVPLTYTTDTCFDPGPITGPEGCATYYLNLATRDQLGQEGVSGPAFVLRYDGAPPTAAASLIDGRAGMGQQSVLRLEVTAEDACSGVAEMRLSHDALAWTSWQPYEENVHWDASLDADGGQTVYVQVRDRAGNTSPPVKSFVAQAVTPAGEGGEPPDAPQVTPLDPPWLAPAPPLALASEPEDRRFGLQAGAPGLDFTNQVTTPLTFWAPAVEELQVSGKADFLTATWQGYVPTMTWAYEPDPAVITGTRIYARFRDTAGTIYGNYETTVFYDGVPPVGSVALMSLTAGVATLDLEAVDENSGVAEMRLAEETTFDAAPWQGYTHTLTTPWPASGVIYVQYRDRAGNVSSILSAEGPRRLYLPLLIRQE